MLPDTILYGGDYNPEQWSPQVWEDDVALMREAGINLVTVGVFSWALLEPEPGRYELGWLDRVLDLLHAGGIGVDLATATAAVPPWFSAAHPESLPVDADGRTLWWGSRQTFCPSSSAYCDAAARLVERLASHYAGHPALRLWHAHNEYGCHNAHCYCDASAAAFRSWLRDRYGDLAGLNEAWSTSFWSQHYTAWEQVLPPRRSTTIRNPSQRLDFWRFCSDELLGCFRRELEILRRCSPGVPVTTNFMGAFKPLDYWRWAQLCDVVSTDHYLLAGEAEPHVGLSFAADVTRSLAGGAPWVLMEHSTSAVNWQPRNVAKAPGQLRRNSLTHLARGADGILFFQWRAARGGAEKFHSALVPHAGTDSKIWREACALGAELVELAPVRGSRVAAEVAILLDWESWWAADLDAHPSADVRTLTRLRSWYDALWHAGITVDFAHPAHDLSRYRVVLAPSLYLCTAATAAHLTAYVDGGGTLAVGFFSGIVDECDRVHLGGYPGALGELLGVRIEEFFPLLPGESVALSDGGRAMVWSELGRSEGAEVLVSYAEGPVAGSPAVTRHSAGGGTAWYVGTDLGAGTRALLERICAAAGVTGTGAPQGVEVVTRVAGAARWTFVINHTGVEQVVPVAGSHPVVVPAGDVALVREQ